MDQNTSFDPMNPSGLQEDRSKIPPPPPSYDQQVGVRSMSSDMESIQRSGGESPQSQILSAGEVFRAPQQQEQQFIPPSSPATPSPSAGNQFVPPPIGEVPQGLDQGVVMEPPVTKSLLKTVVTVVVIVIVAAAVGYGVYYLVTSLQKTPEVPVVPTFSPSPVSTPSSTDVSQGPVVHASLITSPASSEQITLTAVALADFKTALTAASAREKLLAGTVKDISFIDEGGAFIGAEQFLTSFFPSSAPQLAFLFEQDFTAWLYGDKTGGNKFGAILRAKPEVSAQQLSAALALLEGNTTEIGNMFVSSVGAAEQVGGFKEGPIDGTTVRYLAFSAKNQYVFEYVPVQISGKNYVIIATSYYQMSHILKLLGAQPLAEAPAL